MEVFQLQSDEHVATVRALFLEYADQLEHDLCFQRFDQELADLPGAYAPPTGCLLLARDGADWAGCVAVRSLQGSREVCEMKRLYVRPRYRRTGLGRQLARRIIATARTLGYQRMVLDTLATMAPARTLYESLGFRETTAYYDNPLDGVKYYELDLGTS